MAGIRSFVVAVACAATMGVAVPAGAEVIGPITLEPASAPLLDTPVSRNESISLCWSMPYGGAVALGWTVSISPPAPEVYTASDTSGPCRSFLGLVNGRSYTITVQAQLATKLGKPVSTTAVPGAQGYWMVGARGRVYGFGGVGGPPHLPALFAPSETAFPDTIVDIEPNRTATGYWLVSDKGAVFAVDSQRMAPRETGFPPTPYLGGLDAAKLQPGETVTSLSRTKSGNGYWIFTTRGRVFPFGDAQHLGDLAGARLNGAVLDSVATPTGNGYYMVASDGGVFAYGDAQFYGSMGAARLNAPVMSLVPDSDNAGYWLVASDGGIFAFDAPFRGSMGSTRLNRPITGMVRNGDGYLMVGEDGGIFNFSNHAFAGSLGSTPPAIPIVSVASAS